MQMVEESLSRCACSGDGAEEPFSGKRTQNIRLEKI